MAWLLADPAWAPLGYAPYDADGGEAVVLARVNAAQERALATVRARYTAMLAAGDSPA